MSRFKFLKNDFPLLYKLCTDAENTSDIDTVMLKSRKSLEFIVNTLLNNQTIINKQTTLFDNINILTNKNIFNTSIKDIMHSIRKTANIYIHDNNNNSLDINPTIYLNQLFELTVWFAIKQGKKYTLENFSPKDTILIYKYLAPASNKLNANFIDPLNLPNSKINSNKNQNILIKNSFESQEEYEQRIANLPPIHIGYGILDIRSKDSLNYSNIVFLKHYIEKTETIIIENIDAFFVNNISFNSIIDDEILAKLKIYQGKIYCDYNKIYLRNKTELIPLQVINWQKFSYESTTDYTHRLKNLPLLPLGACYPINDYNSNNQTVTFLINPFPYVKKLLLPLLSQNKTLTIPCDKIIAKTIYLSCEEVILFGIFSTSQKLSKYIIWEPTLKEIYKYDFEKEILQKKIQEYLQQEQSSHSITQKIQYLKKAAELGDASAQHKLALYYFNDIKNYQLAFEYFEKAANQGYIETLNILGEYYYTGNTIPQDYQKAFTYFEKSAKSGNAFAQNKLGDCYYYGYGIDKNYQKAIIFYQKAAKQGNTDAQYILGYMYHTGTTVKKDYQKAITFYEKSAKQGNIWAQYKLGNCYYCGDGTSRNIQEAIKWFTKAAIQGHAVAQKNLGIYYLYGNGLTKNYKKAIYWLQKSALQGNSYAQNSLANCYYTGTGIEQNYQQAFNWYSKSAYQKNSFAQYKLGKCYRDGHGISKDLEKAIYWFTKAADQGNTKAKQALIDLQNKSKKKCFITSAVCKALSKSNTCYELTQFRKFRDLWLINQKDGKQLIEEYYFIAPIIVDKINAQINAKEIYKNIWHKYLKFCLLFIEQKKFIDCKILYINMVRDLQKKFNL